MRKRSFEPNQYEEVLLGMRRKTRRRSNPAKSSGHRADWQALDGERRGGTAPVSRPAFSRQYAPRRRVWRLGGCATFSA